MKYIIIGGVAGGASTAARLRRLDEKAEIILIDRGQYVSYANCGLPYYIGNVINEREKLIVQTVQGFIDQFRIDIRTRQEVTAIDPDAHQVSIHNLQTSEEYTEEYDKLVLSPGAEPLRPRIEGIEHNKILTLRNIPDTDAIKSLTNSGKIHEAVVVGGGFIGLEMAENLHELGIHVHVVEMGNQVMAPLDYSMATIVHQQLTDQQIRLHLEDGVTRFSSLGEQVNVHLKSGTTIAADLVILSIGVRPEAKLAREAGLEIGSLGGIRVNEYMQTSHPDIYALGDAIEVTHHVTGKPAMIPLAGPANKQGRIVANNLVEGNKSTYPGTMGTSIAKVFSLTVAATGANAKLLKREGIPYISSFTHGSSHAGYYPDAVSMTLKILFSPTDGRLLGAQVVGFEGVDKRIEMFAQVIQRRGTIYDLMELEHAYAPPFSSAKDPVNMAGFVADNVLNGRVKTITWRDIEGLSEDTIKIDVRTRDEFGLGAMPGFINIPLNELREHLDELPHDRPIVVTCAVGLRGYLAYRVLVQNGFSNVRNLSGGYKVWCTAAGQSICNSSCCIQADEHLNSPTRTTAPASDNVAAPIAEQPQRMLRVDACGLMCPGPIMKLKNNYSEMNEGDQLLITATDQAFGKDVASWCRMTGAELVNLSNKNGKVAATIRKQTTAPAATTAPTGATTPVANEQRKTIVVFSDDLDKALASFVIANGAAAAGKKVTLFFTFWGLNVIKKIQKPAVKKDFFGKMFGLMLPGHSQKLSLSKLNMFGAGSSMMRRIMRDKRIESLESLIQQAILNDIEMIACTMSMDVMGVHKDELLDNVTLGGVATYLERTEDANLNLFI